MIRRILTRSSILFLFSFLIILTGCSKKNESESTPKYIWDIEKSGIPKFVSNNYIELDKIYRISKFRSSIGHDYSDFTEHCRSMKHYFEPGNNVDWTTVKIYSPVTGKITRVEEEWAGTKIEIESEDYPAFRFSIFHINLTTARKVDDKVVAGEQLGTHIGPQTMSDISVIINDPTKQGRMVSYFEVITNDVFNQYLSRGVSKREDMIIPRDIRDADPLICNGETFLSEGLVENWFTLN
jgi:hypothetical protein